MKQSLLAAAFISLSVGSVFPACRRRFFARKGDGCKGSRLAQLQARGAYLARAGNCMGCHTAKGGRPYAGGRSFSTPFGTFVTPNITPDKATGIGHWSADDFWKALHEGKSRDGRPLYPGISLYRIYESHA